MLQTSTTDRAVFPTAIPFTFTGPTFMGHHPEPTRFAKNGNGKPKARRQFEKKQPVKTMHPHEH